MDQDRIFKYIVFIGMAIISISALLVLMNTFSGLSHQCKLQDTHPVLDRSTLNSTVSEDYKAIATFSGYLEYGDPTLTKELQYMPLTLQMIHLARMVSPTEHLLTLSSNCAQLDFFLKDINRDLGKICREVASINIKLIKPLGEFTECFISAPPIKSLVNRHYYNPTPRKYLCLSKAGNVPVASLITEYLEFQITGGDDAKIRKGEYSTDGQSSCI